MSNRVLESLWVASRHGELPVVCDAASCTEGLDVMLAQSVAKNPRYAGLRIEDATTFVSREVLPNLTVTAKLPTIAVHPTCSTTALGATGALTTIAEAVADDVFVPEGWGCCAFAGDRDVLTPSSRPARPLRSRRRSRRPRARAATSMRSCRPTAPARSG